MNSHLAQHEITLNTGKISYGYRDSVMPTPQVPPMRKFVLLFPALFAIFSTGCGKGELKEFTPSDGNFTILMPGKPSREEKDLAGLRMTAYACGSRGEENWIGFVDLPPGNPGDLDGAIRGMYDSSGGTNLHSSGSTINGDGYREFEFQSTKYGGYVAGRVVTARRRLFIFFAMGKNAQLSNAEVRKFVDSFHLNDGPTPGKEEVNAPSSSEPSTKPPPSRTSKPSPSTSGGLELPTNPSNPEPSTVLSPTPEPTTVLSPTPSDSGSAKPSAPGGGGGNAFAPMPQDPPARPGRNRPRPPSPNNGEQPQMVGFPLDPEFKDSAPAGGVLVGFDVGYGYYVNSNSDIVIAVRPIYRVDGKEQFGQIHGTDIKRAVREVAKPGYAVGAISAKAALSLDGFYLTYMKIVNNQLDPNDSYNSPWLGGPGGNGPTTIGGNDGRLVVGIIGRKNNKDLKAIGLEFGDLPKEPLPVGAKLNPPPAPPKIPKTPRFVGGWGDPEFREEQPQGGLLVGFNIGYGGLGNSIITVQGIYQGKGKDGKDKDVFGQLHGTDTRKATKDRAKPGYAVGAISVKGGLWVDGFSITYMKVDGDKLDPTDTYDSPWYGNAANPNDLNLISGDGAPAIGLIGRQGRRDLNALGLLFKQDKQEKQEPVKQ